MEKGILKKLWISGKPWDPWMLNIDNGSFASHSDHPFISPHEQPVSFHEGNAIVPWSVNLSSTDS